MWQRPEVHVSPGFCLLIGWFAAVNGWQSLVMVLAAAVTHELGHWVVLRLLGVQVRAVRLALPGVVLESGNGGLSYGRELAAVLAGPGANLLCALALTALGPGREAEAGAHLVLGIFNLLPVRPLDGGCALHLVSSWLWGPEAGERVTRWTGVVAALAMSAILGCLMRHTGGSLWLLPALAGFLTAAVRETGISELCGVHKRRAFCRREGGR